jgi:alkylation response protein AidB-like acyl-CoA dehydrogenase
MTSNGANAPATDPSVYDHLTEKWVALPINETEWFQRAIDVAEILAVDVVQRDKENKSPKAKIALLKHSGLLKVLGPKKYGGGEQSWAVGYKLIREVAKVDGHGPNSIQDSDSHY